MSIPSRSAKPGNYAMLVLLYVLLLAANQLFIIWNAEMGRFISKCLLMPVLLCYFLLAAGNSTTRGKIFIALALLASWAGDVLLFFETIDNIYFMLGLASFLLAHIFYCIYFGRLCKPIAAGRAAIVSLLVVFYGGTLLYILSPYLGDLKWPVRVYALVISLMLLLSLFVHIAKRSRASMLLASGAFFFVISDSLLAINKFYISLPFAGVAVMSTYGIAQLMIVSGVLIEQKQSAQQSI